MTPEFPDELKEAIKDRLRWKRDGRAAIYTSAAGHTVKVQWVEKPYKRGEHWAASLQVGGVARVATTHYTARYAVEWAESVRLKT